MNHTSKATTLGIAPTAVTLALLVAAVVVVSMMVPIVQTAHASCISSPNRKGTACSGGSPFPGASTSSSSQVGVLD
jgi:hypothetical protein